MSGAVPVSVILPTFNRAATLQASVRSVLEQSFPDFELIVVDDGSNDGTREVVEAFGDGRIRYLRHESTRGPAAARNTGINVARGEYIAFQDSDDIWMPEKLAVQIASLKDAAPRVSICSYRFFKDGKADDVIHRQEVNEGRVVVTRLLKGFNISTQTIVVAADALSDVGGFDESLQVSEDFDLCVRLAARYAFVFLSDPLVHYNVSHDSVTGDPHKFADAVLRLAAKHAALFGACRSGHSTQMYRAGKYLAFAGHYKESLPFVARAVRLDPLNWRAYVLMLGVLTRTAPMLRDLGR